MGGGIGFSFKEGKCPYYNALSSKKIIQFITDAILNIKICLKIPIAKRVSTIVLIAYIIFYNRENIIY
jgi:hypothetical protein